MDISGLIYVIGAWIGVLIAIIALKFNGESSKRLFHTPLGAYLGPKIYGEFFLSVFVVNYLINLSAQITHFGGESIISATNIAGIVFIIVALIYLMIAGFALAKVEVEHIVSPHIKHKIDIINNEINDITKRTAKKTVSKSKPDKSKKRKK